MSSNPTPNPNAKEVESIITSLALIAGTLETIIQLLAALLKKQS